MRRELFPDLPRRLPPAQVIDVRIEIRTEHTAWIRPLNMHRRLITGLLAVRQWDRQESCWMTPRRNVEWLRRELLQRGLVVRVVDSTG